jgi:surfeit locus 1 family protein
MPRRTLAFVVFALVVAAGCVRLGFWQLARLGERRSSNAAIAERLTAPAVPWGEAVRDSARARYRRVQLAGRYDYARELVLTSRGRSGAPGVHVLTPLLVAGSPPILVNRGWAYAADGMRSTRRVARRRLAIVDGFLEEFVVVVGMVSTTSQPLRRLVRDSIEARLGERVAPFIVVQRIGSEQRDTLQHLMRADPPALDEGSHRSYAVQWFAFALIALVGTAAVARRPRQPAPQASSGAR